MCCNNDQIGFGIGTFNTCGCNSCNNGTNAEFVNELVSEYRYNGRNGRSGCGCGRNCCNCGCGCGCGCANNDF